MVPYAPSVSLLLKSPILTEGIQKAHRGPSLSPKRDHGLFSKKNLFIAILFTAFRTFFLPPVFFRDVFHTNDMKGDSLLTKNFLHYCVTYKQLQKISLTIVRLVEHSAHLFYPMRYAFKIFLVLF